MTAAKLRLPVHRAVIRACLAAATVAALTGVLMLAVVYIRLLHRQVEQRTKTVRASTGDAHPSTHSLT